MMAAVVSLSGGLDSATVLARCLEVRKKLVIPVFFRYDSKHNEHEFLAAGRVANHFSRTLRVIDLRSFSSHLHSNLMKNGGEIPEGHYMDITMDQTVVPSRNIIFASILSGYAWGNGGSEVWLGIHAGDHHIYPDCRPEFFASMNAAICLGTGNRIELVAPFLRKTKAEIVREGLRLRVPYELTRTCYKDQELACGKCGACCERLEAFGINNQKDPIHYEIQD